MNHRCRESAISQCVFIEDLERHIENKCKGFAVECFCCQKKFHTYKGIFKHLKYDCQKLKINCQFCGNWLARETFRNKNKHYCYDDFCQVLDKFQGNINKLIEEDTSEQDFGNDDAYENEVSRLHQKLKVLERKNEILMGNSPNLSQLPLILNLLALQKNKSFIDRKICLNSYC